MTNTYARMRQIVGSPADWAAHDLVLGDGELAIERLPDGSVKAKVGDGAHPYSESPYLAEGGSSGGSSALRYMGTLDPTDPPPAGAVPGDAWAAVPGGVVDASWGAPVAGVNVNEGDFLILAESGLWTIVPGAFYMPPFAQRDEYVATAGQTEFLLPAGYEVGYVSVFVNGVKLAETEFDASDGTTIVLDEPAAAGDIVALEGFLGSGTVPVPPDLSDIAYLLPSAAAVAWPVDERIAQEVDVFDALTPAQRSAVRSGALSDIGTALNAIINYATGGESTGDATGGTTLYFRGGRYYSTIPITNKFRADNAIVDDGDLRRLNIRGDGSANTSLFIGGAAAIGYDVAGHNVDDGRYLYHEVRGIRMRRWPISAQTGTGVRLRHVANINFDDVQIDGFNLGLEAADVLGFSSNNLYLFGCLGGLHAHITDWTQPNVFRLVGGAASGCRDFGMRFTRASNVWIAGARFEGNGVDRAGDYCIQLEHCPGEGTAWAIIEGCYFENTKVASDITVQNGEVNHGVVKILGNTFNRTDADRFAATHIDLYNPSTGRIAVDLDSNGFRSFGAYVPSAANPIYRILTSNIQVSERNNLLANPVEAPQTNNYPVDGRLMFHATSRALVICPAGGPASVPADRNGNILAVTRLSAGRVKIDFVRPMNSTNYLISAKPYFAAGYVAFIAVAADSCTVEARNAADVATDGIAFVFETFGEWAA
jgi:hypothetical protein